MTIQWRIPEITFSPQPAFNYSNLTMSNNFASSSIFNYSGAGKYLLPLTLPVFAFGFASPFIFNNKNSSNGSLSLWSKFTSGVSSLWQNVKRSVYHVPGVSSKVQNEKFWKNLGYNAEKGQRLAIQAAKSAPGGFIGKCATYVKKAIVAAGLGNYLTGNGCDMAKLYGNNKNFKKISADGIDVKKLPAGCILVYEAGKSGHHRLYGHTGIALGDGTEVSDGRTRNPKPCSYILIPV